MLNGSCHCGAAGWSLEGDPGSITACNCTLCRRLGALWAYDFEHERIRLHGPRSSYTRPGKADPALEILFCPTCGCVLSWRGLRLEADGRRRIAVNVRLAPPEAVADLPIDHFDRLDTFEDLPPDGKCVRDMWS
jgi:hypothetical protein